MNIYVIRSYVQFIKLTISYDEDDSDKKSWLFSVKERTKMIQRGQHAFLPIIRFSARYAFNWFAWITNKKKTRQPRLGDPTKLTGFVERVVHEQGKGRKWKGVYVYIYIYIVGEKVSVWCVEQAIMGHSCYLHW